MGYHDMHLNNHTVKMDGRTNRQTHDLTEYRPVKKMQFLSIASQFPKSHNESKDQARLERVTQNRASFLHVSTSLT